MPDKKYTAKEIQDLEKMLVMMKSHVQGDQSKKASYIIPGAMGISGLLIGFSVAFAFGNSSSAPNAVAQPTVAQRQQPPPAPRIPTAGGRTDNIQPVDSEDHIRGSVDAPVKIVEFSDFECPFCKRIHPTLQQVVDDYGDQVAWVYRHFPLEALHPVKAFAEAVASECAAELGGNDKFWEYIDKIFEITPSNNRLDQSLLPQIAEDMGLDRAKFEECQTSGRYDQHIADNIQDAQASGGAGTPYSVLIGPSGKTYPISGAQPYAAFKALIDLELK